MAVWLCSAGFAMSSTKRSLKQKLRRAPDGAKCEAYGVFLNQRKDVLCRLRARVVAGTVFVCGEDCCETLIAVASVTQFENQNREKSS